MSEPCRSASCVTRRRETPSGRGRPRQDTRRGGRARRERQRGMNWLVGLLLVGGLIAVFAFWDLIFCGGIRCKELLDRMGRGNPHDPRRPGDR